MKTYQVTVGATLGFDLHADSPHEAAEAAREILRVIGSGSGIMLVGRNPILRIPEWGYVQPAGADLDFPSLEIDEQAS